MALFDCPLDVLRVMVTASYDDEILQATGDKQLALLQAAQISGPQKWPFSRVRQVSLERRLRVLGLIPVPPSNARPCDPYLSDLVFKACGAGYGVGDHDPLVLQCLTAARQCPDSRIAAGGSDDLMVLKGRSLESTDDG